MGLLYETWLGVARKSGSETALHDLASGQRWTFNELLAQGEREPEKLSGITFPQGHDAEFIFSVLRAWRQNQVTCPLELSQPTPRITELPDWCGHLKLTSATGGTAKCIAFTASQLAADAANIVSTMELRPDWPNIACISLAHSYGFSNFVTPLLLVG